MSEPYSYESIIIAASNKFVAAGSVTAFGGAVVVRNSWLADHAAEIAIICSIVGACVAVVGMIVNVIFRVLHYRLSRLESFERRRSERRKNI